MKMTLFNWWGIFFFITPALKVYGIQQIYILDTIFDIWGIISCLLLLIIVIRKERRNSNILKLMYMFVLVYLVSTILNNIDQLNGALSESARLLIVPIYMSLMNSSSVQKSFLPKLRKCFIVLLSVDVITGLVQMAGIILFENRAITFLGLDNYAAFLIIPMLTIVFFASYICTGHIHRTDVVLYCFVLIAKIMTDSLTAILAIVIFGIIIFLGYHWRIIRLLITPKRILISMLILLILIVGFNIQYYFKPIFDYFGRDMTLSYRTVIWSKVLASIPKSPLLGFGKTSADEFRNIVGFSLIYDTEANHPHSYYLAILFTTGVIGVILFIKILIETLKKIYKHRNMKAMYILACGLTSFFIIAFADDYIMIPYLYILIFIINCFDFDFINVKFNNQ